MMNFDPGTGKDSSAEDKLAQRRAFYCRMLLHLDTMLTGKLGRRLAGAPYLTFLLELYLAELEGKAAFQSCIATDQPPANAHRRAGELAKLGALRREADPNDHRRVNLRLEPAIREVLDQAMDRIMARQTAMAAGSMPSPSSPMDPKKFGHRFDSGTSFSEAGAALQQGKMSAGGRLVLPAEIRRSIGLQTGDAVTFELDNGQLRIRPIRKPLGMLQERLRNFAPAMGLASAELIAIRRSEAARGG